MNQPRLNRRTLSICFTVLIALVISASYHGYSLQRQNEVNQLRVQAEARRQKEQIAASVVVILERISPAMKVKEFREMPAFCVGKAMASREFSDVDAEILRQVRQTIPKFQPYSICRARREFNALPFYVVESVEWAADDHLFITIAFREGLFERTYEDGMVYELTKAKGNWSVVDSHMGWIT